MKSNCMYAKSAESQELAGGRDDVDTGTGVERLAGLAGLVEPCGDVEVAFGVDAHPVPASTRIKIDVRAPIGERTVGSEVECEDASVAFCIGMSLDDIQRLPVGGTDDAVGHVYLGPSENLVEDASAGKPCVEVQSIHGVGISLARVGRSRARGEEELARCGQLEVVGRGEREPVELIGQYLDLARLKVGSGHAARSSLAGKKTALRVEE